MRRLRILMVTGIFPPDAGGPATYVPAISESLQERGHRVVVLTTSEPDHLGHDDAAFSFRVVRVNRRKPFLLRTLYLIQQILRLGRQTDLIYANGLFLEAALARRLLGKPLVVKVVGDEAWERAVRRGWTSESFEGFQLRKRHGLKAGSFKALRNLSLRNACRVIVPSRYLARWVRSWRIPEERITVVCNSAKIPKQLQPARFRLPDALRVATAGRLVSWKCNDAVLKAVAKIGGLSLVIVGDGPERRRLEALAGKLGISHRVYFAGQRSWHQTLSILKACNIFVLNSSYEGLPHVLLEAMSLALPVIATRVGGVPEVVEDGKDGILIAPGCYRSLSKALRELAESSKLREALGHEARSKAAHFGFDCMAEQTEEVLQVALA